LPRFRKRLSVKSDSGRLCLWIVVENGKSREGIGRPSGTAHIGLLIRKEIECGNDGQFLDAVSERQVAIVAVPSVFLVAGVGGRKIRSAQGAVHEIGGE